MRAYVLHLVWFFSMCVFVSLQWNQHGLKASVLLTLLTVPPVLVYTVKVHKLCRRLDPKARTVGLIPVLITTIVLSPFEAGLVLPAKNLLEANRILKRQHHAAGASSDIGNDLDNPLKPGRVRTSDRLRR